MYDGNEFRPHTQSYRLIIVDQCGVKETVVIAKVIGLHAYSPLLCHHFPQKLTHYFSVVQLTIPAASVLRNASSPQSKGNIIPPQSHYFSV